MRLYIHLLSSLFHDGGRYHINPSIDLLCKTDWFLYDNGLRHERVKITSLDLKWLVPFVILQISHDIYLYEKTLWS